MTRDRWLDLASVALLIFTAAATVITVLCSAPA